MIASSAAAPKYNGLTKPLLAEVLSACLFLRDLFPVFSQAEKAPNSLLIIFTPLDFTSKSFPRVSPNTLKSLELVPHPNRAKPLCQDRISKNRIPFIDLLKTACRMSRRTPSVLPLFEAHQVC